MLLAKRERLVGIFELPNKDRVEVYSILYLAEQSTGGYEIYEEKIERVVLVVPSRTELVRIK